MFKSEQTFGLLGTIFRFAGVPITHSHRFTASSPLEWKPIRVRKTAWFLSYLFWLPY